MCTVCNDVAITVKPTVATGLEGVVTKLEQGKVRLVYDSLIKGLGLAGLQTTCFNLGIAPITSLSYQLYATLVYKQVRVMSTRHQDELKHVMETSVASSGVSACPDDCL